MTDMKILVSLNGELVTVRCLDREEREFQGSLLEASEVGVAVKYLNHGREFIEFIPMANINSITHKLLANSK